MPFEPYFTGCMYFLDSDTQIESIVLISLNNSVSKDLGNNLDNQPLKYNNRFNNASVAGDISITGALANLYEI